MTKAVQPAWFQETTLLPWHFAVVNFMVEHPTAKLPEVGKAVGRGETEIRSLRRSKPFQAEMELAFKRLQGEVVASQAKRIHNKAFEYAARHILARLRSEDTPDEVKDKLAREVLVDGGVIGQNALKARLSVNTTNAQVNMMPPEMVDRFNRACEVSDGVGPTEDEAAVRA